MLGGGPATRAMVWCSGPATQNADGKRQAGDPSWQGRWWIVDGERREWGEEDGEKEEGNYMWAR